MNKKDYLFELEKNLKSNSVPDIEDILDEYNQHFDFKITDGYSEEQIAARLEEPAVLAAQFIPSNVIKKKGNKAVAATGLVFADIFVLMFFVLLFAWVVVLGAFALCAACLGTCLIGSFNIAGLIPPMPYAGGLILGISCLALGVVSVSGTIYCWRFFVQLIKAYARWHSNTMRAASARPTYPSLPKHPYLRARFKRRLRSVTLIALTVCVISLIAGTLFLFAYTGSIEFWHELGWFGYKG